MGSLFSSLWQLFITHEDKIMAFFMSGQAISFVAAIIMLVRNLKGIKDNTASSNALNKTMENTNKMSDAVVTLDDNFKLLKTENEGLRADLKETKEQLLASNEEIKNKLNAIIDVQAIVYSTIRDDSVRQTVNTILNNARYSEKNFKAELETKMEEMKAAYAEELKNVNNNMNASVDKIVKQLSAVETAKATMENRNKAIRY